MRDDHSSLSRCSGHVTIYWLGLEQTENWLNMINDCCGCEMLKGRIIIRSSLSLSHTHYHGVPELCARQTLLFSFKNHDMDPTKTGSASERRSTSSLLWLFTAKLPSFCTRFIYPKPSCWRFSRVVITILDFFCSQHSFLSRAFIWFWLKF